MNDDGSTFIKLIGYAFIVVCTLKVLLSLCMTYYKETLILLYKNSKEVEDAKTGLDC